MTPLLRGRPVALHLPGIGRRAGAHAGGGAERFRLAIFAALLGPYDLEARPARPMDDAQYARHLEDMVRDQLGTTGSDVVQRARRAARRG